MSLYSKQVNGLHQAVVHRQMDEVLGYIKTARHNEFPPQDRVNVYADGYIIRLVEATLSDYPALSHYMGNDVLKDAVDEFVSNTPSIFWDLNLYPARLAEFLQSFTSDRAAQELAILEATISRLFWTTESEALTAQNLVEVDEEALGKMHFNLRINACLFAFDHAVNAYLVAQRAEEPLDEIAPGPEYIFVVRHDNEVTRHILDKEEFEILSLLEKGKSFNEALSQIDTSPQLADKLPLYLGRWLNHGMFAA